MVTDMNRLMGEIIEDPEKQPRDVEGLLLGLLRALIVEARLNKTNNGSALTPEGP